MKTFSKQLHYLTEQESSQLYASVEEATNKFKKISPEDLKKIEDDPSGYGSKFWDKIIKIVKEIESTNTDSISDNEKNILSDFKTQLKRLYTYDSSFKSIFDKVLPETKAEVPKTTPSTDTTKPTETPKDEYVKGYTGVSIIDFLDQSGKPSDFEARRKLAVDLKIVSKPEDYKGSAQQNTQMLNMLRGGKAEAPTPTTVDDVEVRKAETAQPYTVPKEGKGPTIKFGKMEYPAYVDMGGGKYRLAKQEELDNPNIQLYIPNPKKGPQEYGKPNYVKVRREGSSLRPQSQFGGALGSVSNLFGDIGRTLTGD